MKIGSLNQQRLRSSDVPIRPRPVAFMVMLFRRKPVPNPRQEGPAEVDFDTLWDLAYRPALEQLGYLPVRADSEAGSVIIKDMLELLAFADLVLADMTIPNANVYYEVGIRQYAFRGRDGSRGTLSRLNP